MKQIFKEQPFWIFAAVVVIMIATGLVSDSYFTGDNLHNISRNFSFVAIMALGMTTVILIGGIDLSVGSIMAFAGVMTAMILNAGYPLYVGIGAGLGLSVICGLVNGTLITFLKLPPFVVTLGMLSLIRSLTLVFSDAQMFYEFGPDQDAFLALGGSSFLGLASSVWVMIILTLILMFLLKFTRWGQYLYAVGSNEQAARQNGINVPFIKISAYVLSALTAGISAILMVSWLGAVTNDLGTMYELNVIAATVIGGTNLAGGAGGAIAAVVGSALLEVIRNSLLLAGINPYWQGFFIGVFILFALLLDKMRKE